jgi:hypothetical protein
MQLVIKLKEIDMFIHTHTHTHTHTHHISVHNEFFNIK